MPPREISSKMAVEIWVVVLCFLIGSIIFGLVGYTLLALGLLVLGIGIGVLNSKFFMIRTRRPKATASDQTNKEPSKPDQTIQANAADSRDAVNMQCPKCKSIIPRDAKFCPFCAVDLQEYI